MATIAELFAKFGIEQDKQSFQKAEKSARKLGENASNHLQKVGSVAKKVVGTIGLAITFKKLVSILKNTENIKKAIEEVKKKWTNLAKKLDETYGVTKIIAKWIKNGSNYLLSLFQKIEPRLRDVVKTLGGTENALKSILLIATSISSVKMFKNMFPNASSLKIKAIVGLLTFLYLIIEDIYGFLNGKKSFLGYVLKKYNIDIDKVVDGIQRMKQILLDIGKAILGAFTGENAGAINSFQDLIANVFEAFYKWFTDEENMNRFISGLQTVKEIIEKLIVAAQGIDFAAIFKSGADLISKIPFDKILDAVGRIADYIGKLDVGQLQTGMKGILAGFVGFKALKVGKSVADFFGAFKKADGAKKGISGIGKALGKLKKSKLLSKAKPVLQKAKPLLGKAAKKVGNGAWTGIKAAGKGIGKVASGLGKGIGKGLSKLPGVFSGIGKAAKAAFAVIGVKGLIIIAVIAAIIAIVILLVKNWDKIKEKAQEIAQKVKDKFNEIKEGIKEKLSAIKDAAKEKLDHVKETFSNAFQNIKDFVKNHIVLIMTIITGPIGGLVAYIIKHRDEIKEKLVALKDKIVEIFNGIKAKYDEHIKPIFDWIKGKIDELEQKLANSKFGQWIAKKFGIDLSESEENVEESKEHIETSMSDMADGAHDSGLDYSKNLAAGIRAGIPDVKAATDEVAAAMAEKTHFSVPEKGPLKDQDKWGGDYISNLVNGIRNAIPRLKNMVGKVASSMGIDDDFKEKFQQIADTFNDKVKTNIKRAVNLVAGASTTNIYYLNNNWVNNFNGDQSGEFSKSVTDQEDAAGKSLGRLIANTR